MVNSTDSVFLQQCRSGDKEAQAALFIEFSRRLQSLVDRKLDPRLRRLVDVEDVVQSAFGSLFKRLDAHDIEVRSVSSLWFLLVQIAERRCVRYARKMLAAKRDVRQTVSTNATTDDERTPFELIAQGPTAEQIVETQELLEKTMEGLDDETCRILLLDLHGLTDQEISKEVGCCERTVRRKKNLYRTRLKELDIDQME